MAVRAYKKQNYFIESFTKDSDNVAQISVTHFGCVDYTLQLSDVVGFLCALINTILVIVLKLTTSWFDNSLLAISVITSTNLYLNLSLIVIQIIQIENQMKLIKN